jgi:hypothetical protein
MKQKKRWTDAGPIRKKRIDADGENRCRRRGLMQKKRTEFYGAKEVD